MSDNPQDPTQTPPAGGQTDMPAEEKEEKEEEAVGDATEEKKEETTETPAGDAETPVVPAAE